MQTESSWKTIKDLAADINNCIKNIYVLNEDLTHSLQALGQTFRDEGYRVVETGIKESQSRVDEAVPDLRTIMVGLIAYAEQLKKAEEITKE